MNVDGYMVIRAFGAHRVGDIVHPFGINRQLWQKMGFIDLFPVGSDIPTKQETVQDKPKRGRPRKQK